MTYGSRTASYAIFLVRVVCVSLEVIGGCATGHLPHGLCEVGYKIRGPCVCLSLAYPASSLQYLRTIRGFLSSFRSSDSLSRFPAGFLIFAVTLPQGRQEGSRVKTSAL